MSLFWKDRIIYVDLLHEWRDVKIWDFTLFERVWVTETMIDAQNRHPSNRFVIDGIEHDKPIDAIIIWTHAANLYSKDIEWSPRIFERWNLHSYIDDDKRLTYRAEWYHCIDKDWNTVYAYTVKKNHWELQETFEYMEEAERQKFIVQQAQDAYEKRLWQMNDLLIKWKEIQKKAFNS